MAWKIELTDTAHKQLGKLDKPVARRILSFLEKREASLANPRTLGEPLHGPELGRFWKYRIGDYRVITFIEAQQVTILVIGIGHRRNIYRQ